MWNYDRRIMREKSLLINEIFLVLAVTFSVISECSSALSDKRSCYDADCSVPVSLARTTISYRPIEYGFVSFDVNVEVKVYSKGAGNRTDLWGIEVDGKRGYAPKTFIKEYKILHKNLTHIVSTNQSISSGSKKRIKEDVEEPLPQSKDNATSNGHVDNSETKANTESSREDTVESEAHEMIDGTRVYSTQDKPTVQSSVLHKPMVPNEKKAADNIRPISNVRNEPYVLAGMKALGNIKANKEVEKLHTIEESKSTTTEIGNKESNLKDSEKIETGDKILDKPGKIEAAVTGETVLEQSILNNTDSITLVMGLNDIPEQIKGELHIEGNGTIELSNDNTDKVVKLNNAMLDMNTTEITEEIQSGNTVFAESTPELNMKSFNVEKEKDNSILDKSISQSSTETIDDSTSQTIISEQYTETSTIANEATLESNTSNTSVKDVDFSNNETTIEDTSTEVSKDTNMQETADVTSKTTGILESVSTIINIEASTVIQKTESSNRILQENTTSTEIIKSDTKEDTEVKPEILNKYPITNIQSAESYTIGTEYLVPSENMENISEFETVTPVLETKLQNESDINNMQDIPATEIPSDVSLTVNEDETNEATTQNLIYEVQVSTLDTCIVDNVQCSSNENEQKEISQHEEFSGIDKNAIMEGIPVDNNYWMTLMYLSVTAMATVLLSLGYYYIENMKQDRKLISRINKLEKDLLISEAEYTIANENLKSTKEKLNRMEDESFGSDEMVLSLKADLEASQSANVELKEQVTMLEKDLESATEAGLELEKMLREVLSLNNDVNPLAQSVENLQARLNAQQAANESLTSVINLKTQENETLSMEVASLKKKYQDLDTEFNQVKTNLTLEINAKKNNEETLNDKVQQLEIQMKEISAEKATLRKKLKSKEMDVENLAEVIGKIKSNNLDLDKLYDVSCVKAEAMALLEERNELKVRLAEVEGAHDLLEEHVKLVKEEVATLSEQCKFAEKEKKDAETKLEVLTNFFEEKEAQRQKEEAIWLQQQGEVVSTVERIQTMQKEIQHYKQQIQMLKREILDQEREYKNQMSLLETKAHEQWMIARQVERRLEESKVEAGQLRNRLTLIEKNMSDADSEAKLHRLEANGETGTSPSLFIGAEPSSSPIMFSGSTNVPPPLPPSYIHSMFPHYLPPPLPNASGVPSYEVNHRPPPLGGRLSSPPPIPPIHPPTSNRSPPPPPFNNDLYHPPPFPPTSILPPPSLGASSTWGEDTLPAPRKSGFHSSQRNRLRNDQGSLHSSGESLDKSHHSKV